MNSSGESPPPLPRRIYLSQSVLSAVGILSRSERSTFSKTHYLWVTYFARSRMSGDSEPDALARVYGMFPR